MTWATVTAKEFKDAIRSLQLWLITGLFVIIFNTPPILAFYLDIGAVGSGGALQQSLTSSYVKQMMQINFVFVPLIAILVGYQMIVGEKESGSLKLHLSLPNSRRDLFLGKLLGRTGVVGVAITAAYLIAVPILAGAGEGIDLGLFAAFGALTVFFGLAFFAIAAGFSAGADTSLKAGAGSFGIYVWFALFWNPITTIARGALQGFGVGGRGFFDLWFFLRGLSPVNAYRSLTFILRGESPQSTVENAYATNGWGDLPFYVQSEWELFLLVAWALIPAVLGLYIFTRRDL